MKCLDCELTVAPGRRDVLRTSAALGFGTLISRLGLPAALAAGVRPSGRRFVFLYVPGGWDQLLFLDPREAELTMSADAYKREIERTQTDTQYKNGPNALDARYAGGNYFSAKMYRPKGAPEPFMFGPATVATEQDGTPKKVVNLVQLCERGVPMSIIRGINMGTLGHEPGFMYFLTGEPAVGSTARGTSMPIRIAAKMGDVPGALGDVVTPVLAMGIDSFTGSKGGRYGAFMLGDLGDTARLLRRDAGLIEHEAVEKSLAAFAKRPGSAAARTGRSSEIYRQLRDGSDRTGAVISSRLDQRFSFLSANDEASQKVRVQYGLGAGSGTRSPGALAAFVAQSLKTSLSQFVSVRFSENFVDTHGGTNLSHASGLYPALAAVAALLDDLSGSPAPAPLQGSWLDNTTICLFSEFARGARFAYSGVGKDHHFASSCLLIGAGVRGGTVAGATTTVGGMQPSVFDFDQQRVLGDDAKPGKRQRHILPEDVGATLLASAGLDYGEYRNANPLWSALTQSPF